MNLNNTYYETLDKNFKEALNLTEKTLSHDELIYLLKNGNIPQKQLAALRLDTIKSEDEADIIVSNLTGQDGKIREAVSMRIDEFMSCTKAAKYLHNPEYAGIFLDAIIDVNGNICRNIIKAVSKLRNNQKFCKSFCRKLTRKSFELINKISEFDFKDGKYKVNKEVFKLYWCLETIYNFYDKIDFSELKQILLLTRECKDYTIREKTAKILSLGFADKELQKAREDLKHDKNYYVRRF